MRLREMQEKAAPAKNPRSAKSSYDRPKPPSASEAVFLRRCAVERRANGDAHRTFVRILRLPAPLSGE